MDSETRIHSLGILGITGTNPNFAGHATDILTVFLNSLQVEDGWVVCEAVNSIFEVFAEEQYNHIVKQLDMLPKLSQCLHAMRIQVFSS